MSTTDGLLPFVLFFEFVSVDLLDLLPDSNVDIFTAEEVPFIYLQKLVPLGTVLLKSEIDITFEHKVNMSQLFALLLDECVCKDLTLTEDQADPVDELAIVSA